jgi:hypothetical protein
MRVSVVHLSDMHFDRDSNEILRKVNALVAAICSSDPTCHDYVVSLSGDVANTGAGDEYRAANLFLDQLRQAITKHQPASKVVVPILLPLRQLIRPVALAHCTNATE